MRMFMLFVRVRSHRHLEEDEREHGEDETLYQANEEFQTKKRHRSDIRQEEADNDKENFPCENIAEETEREGNHPRKLGEELEYPDEASEEILPWSDEELPCIAPHAECGDAADLYGDDGKCGEEECHIYVSIHGAQEGHSD